MPNERGPFVNRLVVPLAEITRSGGKSIDVTASESELRPEGATGSTLESAHVRGTLTAVDTEVLFRGSLESVYARACDRCLESATETVEQDLVWYFEPGEEPDPLEHLKGAAEDGGFEDDVAGERVRFYKGDWIDLAPHVWEEAMLAAPTKMYCRDDCKGLCPRCGKNLNEGACDCPVEEETSHTGLAALKEMYPDLPPQTPED